MRVKELIEELKKYDEKTVIKIGKMIEDDYGEYDYFEIELEKKDIMVSRYDGKTTLIIN